MMGKEVLDIKVASFPDLGTLRKSGIPRGRFSVNIRDTDYECLFFPKSVDRLFVVLHGARDPGKFKLPVFQRWSWQDIFPGSVLYVSDPTLDLDPGEMRIGWYIGTQDVNVMDGLSLLVESVVEVLGIGPYRVITYGSSGGGFAALMLASRLGQAMAVAINPQVYLGIYKPVDVERLLAAGFAGQRIDSLPAPDLARMDAVQALVAAPDVKCVYVQNTADEFHYTHHYLPFCQATASPDSGGLSTDGRILTLLYEDPAGHGGEPKKLAPAIISLALEMTRGLDQELLAGHGQGGGEQLAGPLATNGQSAWGKVGGQDHRCR